MLTREDLHVAESLRGIPASALALAPTRLQKYKGWVELPQIALHSFEMRG